MGQTRSGRYRAIRHRKRKAVLLACMMIVTAALAVASAFVGYGAGESMTARPADIPNPATTAEETLSRFPLAFAALLATPFGAGFVIALTLFLRELTAIRRDRETNRSSAGS